MERGSETLAGETADLAQTMYGAGAGEGGGGGAATAFGEPAGNAALSGVGTSSGTAVVGGSRMSTWIAVAAVALAAVAVAVALTGRDGGSATATTTGGAAPGASPAPSAPPADPARAAERVKLVSDPEGARILVNGQDTGVTPADVALADVRGGKVRLSKRGYRAADVRASASQVESGVVLMKLVAEPTGISVAVSGSYPFEMWDGSRKISSRLDPARSLGGVRPNAAAACARGAARRAAAHRTARLAAASPPRRPSWAG